MAFPSVTYTFSNSTTADATQVNQNFTDLINGLSDGTKALSVISLAVATNVSIIGLITAGTWNGTKIGELYGGTNQATYTTGDILYASGTNTLSKLASNSAATAKALTTASSGVPSYSIAIASGVYTPAVANQGNINTVTPHQAQWIQIGNTVYVSASFDVIVTATNASSKISVTLPFSIVPGFPGGFTALDNAVGSGAAEYSGVISNSAGIVYAWTSHAAVTYEFGSTSVSNMRHGITFAFQIS